MDPAVTVKPVRGGQVDDLIGEIRRTVDAGYRVLVTTLTKRMAEDLTDYLREIGIKVRYLHSEIQTLERVEILRGLRLGDFDVLVGINLLREGGLDLPEVGLVAILDADKEGFLRSDTSLIQTIGRAARNVDGRVIMYADQITGSMREAIDETERRRSAQIQFNREHGITPESNQKEVRDLSEIQRVADRSVGSSAACGGQSGVRGQGGVAAEFGCADVESMDERELARYIKALEDEMKKAAGLLEFERAAELRDTIRDLRRRFVEL